MLCITSISEGDWPLVVLESAAFELPVLSLYLNYDDLIGSYHGGVYCHGDLNLLKSTISKLSLDESKRIAMGQNARKYVLDHHDLNMQSTRLDSIIQTF
jgi:glycosyltransferase involved in cell wall biosynthesis